MLVECSTQVFYILSVNLPYPFSVAKRKKVHIRAGEPLKNALYICRDNSNMNCRGQRM